ncbi:DNA segregation ATPase, FtsK/SpoIIIE family [Actinobacteria bacterium IMCC26207]|nr:DNA segregation ATPase, FtsK/SpoIIIE family [Actinobacteria bacterium IMCC26207]
MSSAGAVVQLPLRMDDGTGTFFDLMIELAPDAHIGELADHLAERFGAAAGQTISTGALSEHRSGSKFVRSDLISTSGPRAGDTIHLTPQVGVGNHETTSASGSPEDCAVATPDPTKLAPVYLRSPSGSAEVNMQLSYGLNQVQGATIEVAERVEIRATGAATPAVNGAQILGSSRLSSGDLLNIKGQLSLLQITDHLRPPLLPGPTEKHKITSSARILEPAHTVSLPTPPAQQRLPGFPVLSAMVPLLMGAALWMATKSLASALFVLFSFVFVLASGLEARRESRADQKFRVAEFRSDLAEADNRISQLHQQESARLDQQIPPSHSLGKILSERSDQLWTRSFNAAQSLPLRVRLGTAQSTPQVKLQIPTQGRRDLREELLLTAKQYSLAKLPSIIDLDQTGGIGIVGRDELATALARSLLLQLAVALPPEELEICVLAQQDRLDIWRWCAWLPHCRVQGGSARTLLVIDGTDDDLVRAAIEHHGRATTRVLWLSARRAGLPPELQAIVELGQQHRLILHSVPRDDPVLEDSEEHRVLNLSLEDLTEDEAVPLARSLAPLQAEQSSVVLSSSSGSEGESPLPQRLPTSHLPAQVNLHEVLANQEMLLDPRAVIAQWALSADSSSLAAPLGKVANGVLHLDLRSDGPHALIAGTTGSGKSELLRSLVASMALHHSPKRLSFLLVDYKGGAAFRTLTSLPHTVGLITDLSPQLAKRALVSLRAELHYREAQLARLGISEITETPKNCSAEVPPALIVVVDEFATLARELPEFVDGLVDLSQRGRSLGMHLVLATQRPAGVVTDAIRANTGLRIALRVADEEDSRDVVEIAEAALLPREVPGRAILRSGPGQCAAVQLAYSGSSGSPASRVQSRPLGDPPPRNPFASAVASPTELDLAVSSAISAAAAEQLGRPRPPWLEALPEHLKLSQVQSSGDALAIGWTDRPDQQRRELLEVNLFRDGGLLLLGASGSGRSTALQAGAMAAITQFQGRVQIYGIDAGTALGALQAFSQVGAIISVEDSERVLRLLRRFAGELQTRSQPSGMNSCRSPHLLLIDGFGAFEELYERINRGEAMELLLRIARDGRSLGLHVLLAANRRADVPPRLAALLGCQIFLRSPTEDDALMLGLEPESAAKETPPGRGWLQGHQVQVAQPDDLSQQAALRHLGTAEEIAALPRRLRFSQLPSLRGTQVTAGQVGQGGQGDQLDQGSGGDSASPPWNLLPCGLEAEQMDLAILDLTHHHALVAGPPRSGKSSTLNTLALALHSNCNPNPNPASQASPASFLLAAHVSTAHDSTQWSAALLEPPCAADASSFLRATESSIRSGTPTLIAVDDVCSLLELPDGDQIETELAELVKLGRTHPVRLVLSGDVDSLLRSYSDLIAQLRSSRTGILLGVDPDHHGALLHCSLEVRSELLPCTGRGWLVSPTAATAVQIAHP